MAKKTYRGEALDVAFDLDICIHAGECVRSLPKVFDTERRPWILPDEGDADELRDVVSRCPSGALEIVEHGTEAPAAEGTPAAEIRALPGGPLLVSGSVTIVGEDGEAMPQSAKVALCRCGKTQRGPLCDGSHARD